MSVNACIAFAYKKHTGLIEHIEYPNSGCLLMNM